MSNESRMSTFVPENYVSVPKAKWDEQQAELERLRARVAELEAQCLATRQWEAEVALHRGTMAQTQEQPSEFQIVDAPPSTPR